MFEIVEKSCHSTESEQFYLGPYTFSAISLKKEDGQIVTKQSAREHVHPGGWATWTCKKALT